MIETYEITTWLGGTLAYTQGEEESLVAKNRRLQNLAASEEELRLILPSHAATLIRGQLGAATVMDLVKFSAAEVLAVSEIGSVRLSTLRLALGRYGLALRDELPACRYCGGCCPNEPKDSPYLCRDFLYARKRAQEAAANG